MAVVFLGWILFRAENLPLFFAYVKNMFVEHGGTLLISAYLDRKMQVLILLGVWFCGVGQLLAKKLKMFTEKTVITVWNILTCMILLWLCIMSLVNNSYNPFIYFRF